MQVCDIMSYRIYSGDKKSLVFPIMGDGYVHLDYSKHIPTDSDDPYGLWGHKSSFTIEGIVTPYDVNGFGWSIGKDYTTTGGVPNVSTNIDATNLELPFTAKAFSSVGNTAVASSRSSAYFSHEHVAYLAEAINDSVTAFEVTSTEYLHGGNYIRIGNEKMLIVSIDRHFGNSTEITVTRAYDGTTAISHSQFAPIYTDNRLNHKMTLFYNNNCEFYLKNMTRTNMNQPAEYKIGCVLKGKDKNGNVTTVTIESNSPVITADEEYYGSAIEQTNETNFVFGKPVHLSSEDRVKYHRITQDDGYQVDIDRVYVNSSDYSGVALGGGNTVIDTSSVNVVFDNANTSFSGSPTIFRNDGTSWTSGMRFIKVVGSANNDGFYQVRLQSGATLVLDTNDWIAAGNSITSLLIDETMTTGTLTIYHTLKGADTEGVISFITQGRSSLAVDGVNNLDMANRMWRGRKLYTQFATSRFYSSAWDNSSPTNISTIEQKEPISLGYIETIHADSDDDVDYAYMAACKLVKPVRTKTETTFYVDDARDISVTDILRLGNELVLVTAISGNTLTVTRGYDASTTQTTNLQSDNNNVDSGQDYKTADTSTDSVTPKEEFYFARTLYKTLPSKLFNGLRLVNDSGATLVDVGGDKHASFGAPLLGETWKEASYLLRPFHLSMSYDINAKRINLMIDGVKVPTQQFNEKDFVIDNIVGDGGVGDPSAIITTIDPHGLTAGDYVSIEGANDADLNGIWVVNADPLTANSFLVVTENSINSSISAATDETLTVRDVTIRTDNPIVDFEFDKSDCYLGSNGNDVLETRRASQFMGEIHEFAITKDVKENFNSLDTLIPNFRNTLLYFRFEGENS